MAAAAGAFALVAACSAPPDYQYVASTDRSLVLKMPREWKALDSAALGAAAAPGRWDGFYDSADRPSATDFFGELPISSPDAPVVRLLSVKIDPGTPVLTDDLRDVFVPNSEHELRKFANQALIDDVTLVGYRKLLEEEVETKTAIGLKIVSGYAFDKDPTRDRLVAAGAAVPSTTKPTVVVEKLALVAKDGRHLHVIAVWCNATCFQKNQQQIEDVVSSFTVKLQS